MAGWLIIEEESGTGTGTHHRHNGYYAGDFDVVPMPTPRQLTALGRLRPPTFPDSDR